GGAQPSSGGDAEAFVARLSASLTTLRQTTYLGGGGFDQATAIAVAPQTGDVYVVGQTSSPNFPVTAGAAQTASPGGGDAFVARLDATLTRLAGATFLGGSGSEVAQAVTIAPQSGDVFVAGYTSSPDFPGTAGAAQPAKAGGTDAFVARLSASLGAVV